MTSEKFQAGKRASKDLGSGWSFDRWDGKESWKNHVSYQILNAYNHKTVRFGKDAFEKILTGSDLTMSQKKKDQERQQECLDEVGLPVEYDVSILSDTMIIFVFKDDYNKSKTGA